MRIDQSQEVKPTVAIIIPMIDRLYTEGKVFVIAKWLADAGYNSLLVVAEDGGEATAREVGCPWLRIQVSQVPINVTEQAKLALPIASHPVIDVRDGSVPVPTLGDLIVMDDYLGGARCYDIKGAEAFRPDLIVTSIPGADTHSAEDNVLSLTAWRFARANHIPVLGIEILSLRNDLYMIRWPCDLLLTKADPRHYQQPLKRIAPAIFPLPAAHTYLMRPGRDAGLDNFLAQERAIRERTGPAEARYLYVPFLLHFKQRFYSALQAVNCYAKELLEFNFYILISCDAAGFRRGLSEKEIAANVAVMAMPGFPGERIILVEGGIHPFLGMISEAVIAPYECGVVELLETWRQVIVRPGEERALRNLACGVSVVQGAKWLLDQQERRRSESANIQGSAPLG